MHENKQNAFVFSKCGPAVSSKQNEANDKMNPTPAPMLTLHLRKQIMKRYVTNHLLNNAQEVIIKTIPMAHEFREH